MRKVLIVALVALFPLVTMAQENAPKNEGKIVFTTKSKVKLSGNIANMLSKEQLEKLQNRVTHKELLFNSKESVYKRYDAKKDDDTPSEQQFSSGGANVVIKFAGASNDDKLYYNVAENKVVDMRTFMGRRFLIKDEASKAAWKIKGESKKILGYECKKAVMEKEKLTIEAWFTMQIPVAAGPEGYGKLPGMILELKKIPKPSKADKEERKESENGVSISTTQRAATTTTATKINFTKLDKGAIVPPKKGKKVTRKQFRKIVKKKTEEMKEMYRNKGGGIRIERN
ncbi:hypothetical protein BKI52_25255 [marine bacterium AO1-C]|nr:hypothetical protein BKI52_25255 [marine bacterium AO1-C]